MPFGIPFALALINRQYILVPDKHAVRAADGGHLGVGAMVKKDRSNQHAGYFLTTSCPFGARQSPCGVGQSPGKDVAVGLAREQSRRLMVARVTEPELAYHTVKVPFTQIAT